MVGKGVERVQIKAVDNAVERYVKARDRRMDLTKEEVEAKVDLITVMRKNTEKIGADAEGTMIYHHDDLVVILKHGKDDLKVRNEETTNGDED